MRLISLLLLTVCMFVASHAAAEQPEASQQLQPLLDEMLLAANAHDTDRFMALYDNSPALVLTFDDTTLRGWQAIRDQQLEWWNGGTSDAVYRLRSAPQVTVIDADVVATLQDMDVTATGPDGKSGTVRVVATSIWKKLPEGWRIVLAHESMIH